MELLYPVADSIRFAAFVIAYKRADVLKKTLDDLFAQTKPPDYILVVDNGRSEETKRVVESFPSNRVGYQAMKENLGPAGAAAYGLKRLADENYDWIYWGDEDDPPLFSDTLERVLTLAINSGPDVAGAGAVGSPFSWKTGESARFSDEALKGIVEVDSIGGNSQFIISKRAVDQVGVPDARLFFGYYEREYCFRVRRAGFRFLVDGAFMWKHRKEVGRLNLKSTTRLVSQYPYELIWRRYYRTRNYIFMMRKTFNRPDLARRETWKAIGRTVFSFARGPKYAMSFTRYQLLGILHGYRAKMGRTVQPSAKEISAPEEKSSISL